MVSGSVLKNARAVRVDSGRRKPNQHVSRRDEIELRQELRAADGADGEAGEVVVAGAVHAGHLRRLAAEQRAVTLGASLRDPADDRRRLGDVELARCEVVEEEEWLDALGRVHARLWCVACRGVRRDVVSAGRRPGLTRGRDQTVSHHVKIE